MSLMRRLTLAAATAALLAAPALAEPAPVVKAPAGTVSGTVEDGMRVFKGIPFAVPPVGKLRWTAPKPLPRWKGTKKASEFGPSCVQPVSTFKSVYWAEPSPMSEDCLTLNIWAPKTARKAPVFVWIYGGALWGGRSSEVIYNGTKLAQRGLIVVSINYRLGVLGWLAHPGLSAESPDHISGNYGLLDQIAALEWIKRNIASFGGDPANVTIAGESAGGLSVMYLMASPKAQGLFAKAIAQSAYMVSTPALKEKVFGQDSAEDIGTKFAAAVHANSIADLRAMDAATITKDAAEARFPPFGAIDGVVLTGQLVDVFDSGKGAHVPILAGFNQGEIRSLRVLAPQPPASADAYEATIRARYGDLADAFLKLYPSTDLEQSIIATTRDALYGWTAQRLVRRQTALGAPSYLYLFDHGYPAADDAKLHAFHGSELPFMFGTTDRTSPLWPKIPDTAGEHALSDAMVDYWASFARSGKPTAKGQPDWPAYGATAAYMDFTDAPHPSSDLMPGMFALDEAVVCRRHASGDIPWNWNVGLVSPPLPAKTATCP